MDDFYAGSSSTPDDDFFAGGPSGQPQQPRVLLRECELEWLAYDVVVELYTAETDWERQRQAVDHE